MAEDISALDEQDSLIDIAEYFINNNFRRVPITSEGKLVGLISRKDIIKYTVQLRHKNKATA
ncbi:MAG: CBS domain-containing protein [Phycisphaerales bacterium]|jgi:CBS domain-containing protein